tara:strand:- start:889 stop:2352 length:1464 start_codon:yes stop_codon:yes gene_type:complete
MAGTPEELQVRLELSQGTLPSVYNTPEEAAKVSNLIGCQGYHTHLGGSGYMPCASMESYNNLINDADMLVPKSPFFLSIKSYNASSYITTGKLQLKDKITITDTVIDGKIKIGNHLMGYLTGTGGSGTSIVLRYNNSNEPFTFTTIHTVSDSEQIIAFDINDVDNSIIAVTSTKESCRYLNLYRLDASNIQALDPSTTYEEEPGVKTGFMGTITRYRTSVSDYPLCPVANIDVKFSSHDSNVYVLTDNSNVITSFISNPGGPASFASRNSLLYPPKNVWSTFNEKSDRTQLKWNTDKLPSNTFNNINFLHGEWENEAYTLLHNVGRIYLSSSKRILYNNLIPLDLVHNYNPVQGSESSLGISLNSELQAILKDALNIFYNINIIPVPKIVDGVYALGGYTSPTNIPINFRDMEFHENEEVNYNTIWRVFSKIYEFQRSIMEKIITPPTDDITAVDSMLVNYRDNDGKVVQVEHKDDGSAILRQGGAI